MTSVRQSRREKQCPPWRQSGYQKEPSFPLSHSLSCSRTWQMSVDLLLLARHCARPGGRAIKSYSGPEMPTQRGDADEITGPGARQCRVRRHHQRAEGRVLWGRGHSSSRTWPTLSHGKFLHPHCPICFFVFVVFISGFVFPSLSQ